MAKFMMRDLARGLFDLHALGIVHRDMKPLNVLVSSPSAQAEQVRFKIADFGISFKLRGEDDSSQWRIGTAGFMAPEVMVGLDYATSCDVFSLGCILHWFIS